MRTADGLNVGCRLTYKPGTDTLRRSSAVELCEWLAGRGATVRAHDPAVKALAPELASRVQLVDSPLAAVDGAAALVVATPWPVYRQIPAGDIVTRMTRRLVLDANRFLGDTLGDHADMEYCSVGKASA